jgi:mono/diheme cytochrome c family protein
VEAGFPGPLTPRGAGSRLWSVVAMALAITATTAGAQAPRSVWDGVFSVEQAKKGEALAVAQCVSCHGDGLRGGEAAPPLTGDLFNSTWEGVLLSDLADRIRTTMPIDRPGTLSRQQTADVLAYMLSLSKIPAGAMPLPADAGTLTLIKYLSYPPQP